MAEEKEKLYFEDRATLIPGETIAQGLSFIPGKGTYRDKDDVVSSLFGFLSISGRVLRVIPFAGRYMPKKEDLVIGKITAVGHMGWQLDIDCPYNVDLSIGEARFEYIDTTRTDLSKIYDVDDYIVAKIIDINKSNYIKLTTKERGLGKLIGGNIIKASPTKVPRVIGKQASMIRMLKDATGADITVGQNGLIWIRAEPKQFLLLTKVIKKIEEDALKSGLTDSIKETLEKETGKKLIIPQITQVEHMQEEHKDEHPRFKKSETISSKEGEF